MAESFQTISDLYQAEIVEKKSRFIATLAPVSTPDQAVDFIKEMKKKYWDARHNCSAYILGTKQQVMHSSDDGEPSGTAGKPILSVLSGHNLYNVVAVVTRYFGGTLLGTGGLVRAYSRSVEECISNAVLKKMIFASQIQINCSYNDVGKLQYMFAQNDVTLLSSEYSDSVRFQLLIPVEKETSFLKALTEATQSKALAEVIKKDFFEL